MMYGLYLSASGVQTSSYRLDVLANNLANVNTASFKPDMPTVRQREAEALEDDLGMQVRNRLLDRLGGGVLAGPQHVDYSPATLKATGRNLDLAIEAKDVFFRLADAQGRVALTRDGRFQPDAQGYLSMATTGRRVLDAAGAEIGLDSSSPVSIDASGRVRQDGRLVANLGVVHVRQTDALRKQGENIYHLDAPAAAMVSADSPGIRQGFIENSGVDPIKALMGVTSAGKAMQSNAEMIQHYDRLMEQAVNTLGRVSA